MHDRLLPERAQDRELERLGRERQPEVEVEDVRLREEPQPAPPLRRLPPGEAAAPLERPSASGWRLVAVEHDEPRVNPSAPERLDVRPRHAGRVHRTVGDAKPSRGGLSQGRSCPRRAVRAGACLRFDHRAHRLAHRRHRVDPDLGWTGSGATATCAGAEVLVGHPDRQCWFESERYVSGANYWFLPVRRPRDGRRTCTRAGVVPREDRFEPAVELAFG